MSSISSSSLSPLVSALIQSSSSSSAKPRTLLFNNSKPKPINPTSLTLTPNSPSNSPSRFEKLNVLLLQSGALMASVGAPRAFAVTGENGGDDLVTTLVSGGIVAGLYLFVIPPILMNWMRLRWYKRKFLEMYLQFMCVFIFFPGLLLWAPFINFRKFPRDPTMEYPWSTPKDDVPLYKSR